MTAGLRYRLPAGVVAQVLDQEMVLLDTTRGLYFDLNPSGTLLLDALLQGQSIEMAIATVVARFEVEASQARADLTRLLGELTSAGLVTTDQPA